MGSPSSVAVERQDAQSANIAITKSSAVKSSKNDLFQNDIQSLCDLGKLPPRRLAYDWKVYLHKRSVLNGDIPHERLILEQAQYILSVELSNTEGGSSGVLRGDWRVYASIVDESKDNTRQTWTDHGKANFSLEHLESYVKNVIATFGPYNVFTQNCQKFARDVAAELGKEVKGLNDGTKGLIGIGSGALASGLLISASVASGGKVRCENPFDDD